AWIQDEANYARMMGLVVLVNPTSETDVCRFDQLELRYANPDNATNQLRPFEFVRLMRFIRLWKKLGWTIEQTDTAIAALYPAEQLPDGTDDALNLQRLDEGFLTLLPRLGYLKQAMEALNLNRHQDLRSLLACFAPIATHGGQSLYRQMFLSSALAQQAIFAEDGYGNVLTDENQALLTQREALRAAFLLTEGEFEQITTALEFDESTPLTLENISHVYRWGWFARSLSLSVQELLLLTRFSGLDPFAPLDPTDPPFLGLIRWTQRLRDVSLKPVEALYLIWNQDISGQSSPAETEILALAHQLRTDLNAIDREFSVASESDAQVARDRMAMVYPGDAADFFFGLLENTLTTSVSYNQIEDELNTAISAVTTQIAYDSLRKELTFTGVLTEGILEDLNATDDNSEFQDAVDRLYAENQNRIQPFFQRYPELWPLYETYVTSDAPEEQKRTALLDGLLPELKRQRKGQQTLQSVSAFTNTDINLAYALLNNASVLHAAENASEPILNDLIALEIPGLAQTDSTNPIASTWTGYLTVPENGFYNLRIRAAVGAEVALTLVGEAIALAQSDAVWSNATAISLQTGQLYPITLTIENADENLDIQWQTTGLGWQQIPANHLYSEILVERLHITYLRFLKTISLATELRLTANEITFLASQPDDFIDNQGWLNALPAIAPVNSAIATALLAAFNAWLTFAELKAKLAPDDEQLLTILQDPVVATEGPDSLLFKLTRWDTSSLEALLAHFGYAKRGLARVQTFSQIASAFQIAKRLGVSTSALIAATTNEPDAAAVQNLQAALRARYDQSRWLQVLQPINDKMRGLQRDALVAYILHQMSLSPSTAHINTPEKLFEYFLMDVQMEPCMQTSRIRHALSSVQLFIERCLMNLEPRVSPISFKDAERKQWEWMKRYRVWEANRKVFLYPENWLEPELRDDQSPFFRETMSELLQGDITEERAAEALLNYLSRLDEVAKLEPCGIH
ncbi:MAG: neuraminidase-like domain-containing protein, partial [Cyanobacteria bacterium P01_D01_bin.115]